MKFSIVTPALNSLGNIQRCVGSVRRQEDVELQHIVQDGGSTDGTAEWAAKQPDLDAKSQPDESTYQAISMGWERSDGDILSWLNTDEQYLPGALAVVKGTFDEHPRVDAIFADYIVCDSATGRPLAARREIPLRRSYVTCGTLYAMSCTLFFRRSLYRSGLLAFDATLKYVADIDLVVRLLDRGVRFFHLPKYLSTFGITSHNLSTTPRALAELTSLRKRWNTSSRLVRAAVTSGRIAEKFIRGCYAHKDLSFNFCVDENGHGDIVEAKGLGTVWRWG